MPEAPCEHDYVYIRTEFTGPNGQSRNPDTVSGQDLDIFRCRKCLKVRSEVAVEYVSNGHYLTKHVIK